MDPHHVVRRNAATRHDPANGMPLCRTCHSWVEDHPQETEDWLRAERPADYRYFVEHRHDVCPDPDYEADCHKLQAILDGQDAGSPTDE